MRSFIILLCVGTAAARAQDLPGRIVIRSAHSVHSIRVDDSLHQDVQLPMSVVVRPGKHRVSAYRPERIRVGEMDFQVDVVVGSEEEKVVEIQFRTLGRIHSYPHGASVSVGGLPLGDTPTWVSWDDYRGAELLIRKAGFQESHVTVGDTLAGDRSLWVTLRPSGTVNPDNELLSAGWREKGLGKRKWWLMYAAAGALVSGGLAAYGKVKADNAFEKAKLAHRRNDFAAEEAYHDRTRRYDRIALAGFVGLQISFTGGMVILLKAN